MAEPRQQTPEASIVEVTAAPKDAGRAAREWWWAGRLLALHGFPVEHCPYYTPGAPRRRWLAGFASGTRVVAGHTAQPA